VNRCKVHGKVCSPLATQLHVVITDCPWEDDSVERKILEEGGVRVTRAQCATPQEVIVVSKDADALLVGWAPITQEVIGCLSLCRLLMRYGTGYDNIDLDAATRAGIAVAINADYCLEEVATHAFAMLLACHRQLGALQDAVRKGRWDPLDVLLPCPPLSQQIVGILGFGRIGRHFAEMVCPLVKQVLVHDPVFSESAGTGPLAQFVSFDHLLAESDYVSIHVPLTRDTHHLFDGETLSRMKKGAYLINCARGAIVDENALVESLQHNHLAGAALDVFSKEPLPADHPLRSFPRVIVTPHAAWYSTRADHLLRANPAHNILRFLRDEPIPLLNKPTLRGT
jgi:D-3-phosphoglycerate dehydrogenase